MGYSPWGHKELDMTEVTQHTHSNLLHVCVCIYIYIYTHTHTRTYISFKINVNTLFTNN